MSIYGDTFSSLKEEKKRLQGEKEQKAKEETVEDTDVVTDATESISSLEGEERDFFLK